MDEHILTPDEEVAMILSSDKGEGPSRSKKPKLISNDQPSRSCDEVDHNTLEYRPSEGRSIGHSIDIWDDSSNSDELSSDEGEGKVYPNVDAYLESIPQFDTKEHRRIPYYMELLGDNAHQIRTDLPKSNNYSDEEMVTIKNNLILSQLDFLVRENIRRTTREARKEARRESLIEPSATAAPK